MMQKKFRATHEVVSENKEGMMHGLPVGERVMFLRGSTRIKNTSWYETKIGHTIYLNDSAVSKIDVDPCILIVGHGEHGKDTLAEIVTKTLGHRFRGSSQVAAREVIYPMMSNFYSSSEEAFNDRRNNRRLWESLIRDFNRSDKSRLAKLVCQGGYGYTGLRDRDEVLDCIKTRLFTHIIWIERPDKPNNDPTMSFSFEDLKNWQERERSFHLMRVENDSIEGLHSICSGDLKQFLKL